MGKPNALKNKKNHLDTNFDRNYFDSEALGLNGAIVTPSQNDFSTIDFSNTSCSIIASEDTWLEEAAKTQLAHVHSFEDMCCVVGMPDLHPGIDAPIGASFLSQNHIYPALVGSDIGCGIALWETQLPSHKASPERIIKQLGNLDFGLDKSWYQHLDDRRREIGLRHADFDSSLGTIGSGNHFAEVTVMDKIYGDYATQYNLCIDKLHLLIHTGSRGLGQLIFRKYAFEAGHKGILYPSVLADQYLMVHDQALLFAQLNRELVAKNMLARLHTEGREILSIHHNFVEKVGGTNHEDAVSSLKAEHFLHRKGAAPSDRGLVVIAGNRGDYSYLVEPRASLKSLNSIAHGAGRKWKRSACKGRLEKRYRHWRDLETTQFGGRVVCEDRNLAYEEAPEAYKSIDSIIESLLQHHLIRVVARLKPIVTYKTMGK